MRYLPRVDGAGHGVVLAVVHGVWGPAVPTHALCAVVSGHGQVLEGREGGAEIKKGSGAAANQRSTGDGEGGNSG